MVIETSRALTLAGFSHGYSTRGGGVSASPDAAADFALLRDPLALAENLARLGAAVGFDPAAIFQVKQVHGSTVREAEGDPLALRELEGDAVIASCPRIAVGVRVADCVPVLVGDTTSGHAFAIHAGWRGVVNGVVGEALSRREGGRRVGAIGPCIGACCFEVSEDVAEQIARAARAPSIITSRHGDGKAKVDLRAAVRAQLRRAGLRDEDIDDVGGCSRCDAERYHSYRRDGDASGRMLAVIVARGRESVTGP